MKPIKALLARCNELTQLAFFLAAENALLRAQLKAMREQERMTKLTFGHKPTLITIEE